MEIKIPMNPWTGFPIWQNPQGPTTPSSHFPLSNRSPSPPNLQDSFQRSTYHPEFLRTPSGLEQLLEEHKSREQQKKNDLFSDRNLQSMETYADEFGISFASRLLTRAHSSNMAYRENFDLYLQERLDDTYISERIRLDLQQDFLFATERTFLQVSNDAALDWSVTRGTYHWAIERGEDFKRLFTFEFRTEDKTKAESEKNQDKQKTNDDLEEPSTQPIITRWANIRFFQLDFNPHRFLSMQIDLHRLPVLGTVDMQIEYAPLDQRVLSVQQYFYRFTDFAPHKPQLELGQRLDVFQFGSAYDPYDSTAMRGNWQYFIFGELRF